MIQMLWKALLTLTLVLLSCQKESEEIEVETEGQEKRMMLEKQKKSAQQEQDALASQFRKKEEDERRLWALAVDSYDEIRSNLESYYCMDSRRGSHCGFTDDIKYWAIATGKRTIRTSLGQRGMERYSEHEIEIECRMVRPDDLSGTEVTIRATGYYPPRSHQSRLFSLAPGELIGFNPRKEKSLRDGKDVLHFNEHDMELLCVIPLCKDLLKQ